MCKNMGAVPWTKVTGLEGGSVNHTVRILCIWSICQREGNDTERCVVPALAVKIPPKTDAGFNRQCLGG